MTRFLMSLVTLCGASALACGWDYETFVAETGSLPCVEAVALVRPPKHSPLLLQRRVDVAELALLLVPSSLAAHDARTNALLHLGKLPLALESAKARAGLAPDDYGSRANLGTVLTFTGDLEAALVEVKAVLAKDPQAHFGREKFHARFLEYLLTLPKDATLAAQRDFLGLTPSSSAKDVPEHALEALLSMLGVYGASENPHLLFALGNVLNAQGEPKLAFAAWKSALERKHPGKTLLVPVMEQLNAAAHDAWKKTLKPGELRDDDGPPLLKGARDPSWSSEAHWQLGDQWAGLWWSARQRQDVWSSRQTMLNEAEEKQLALGTPVWTEAGLQVLLTSQRRLGFRCPTREPLRAGLTPGLFDAPDALAKVSDEGLAWLSALEQVTVNVQDARGCENVRPALLERLKKNKPPKVSLAARESVLADPATRERFLDVFDRFALVLSKCAPKSGNAQVLAALKESL